MFLRLKELVKARGYKFEGELPLVVSDDIESMAKTKDVVELLLSHGGQMDIFSAAGYESLDKFKDRIEAKPELAAAETPNVGTSQ